MPQGNLTSDNSLIHDQLATKRQNRKHHTGGLFQSVKSILDKIFLPVLCCSDVGKDSDRIDAVAQIGTATGFSGQWSPD